MSACLAQQLAQLMPDLVQAAPTKCRVVHVRANYDHLRVRNLQLNKTICR